MEGTKQPGTDQEGWKGKNTLYNVLICLVFGFWMPGVHLYHPGQKQGLKWQNEK